MSKEENPEETQAKMKVVSVRFPGSLLERIAAVAEIEGRTSNEVIRMGMESISNDKTGSTEFRKAAEEYVEKAKRLAAIALGSEPGEIGAGEVSEPEDVRD